MLIIYQRLIFLDIVINTVKCEKVIRPVTVIDSTVKFGHRCQKM